MTLIAGALASTMGTATAADPVPGVDWVSRTSAADNPWTSVTYGNGLFVAVASSGTNRVMTSPDGITWTARTSPTGSWTSVAYGGGAFVAVATSGEIMRSTDGVNWNAVSAPLSQYWTGVAYGNGTFVVVTNDSPVGAGADTYFLTSPDGVTWTIHQATAGTSAAEQQAIAFGNGTFVSISRDRTTNDVMTSTDGASWTVRTTPSPGGTRWGALAYGDSRFVAVGSGAMTMWSADGAQWNLVSPSGTPNTSWNSIAYGSGLFVAVSGNGTGNRVMTSPDGAAWTSRASAADNTWTGVTYAHGLFVAVGSSGSGNRVMTSGTFVIPPDPVTPGTPAATPTNAAPTPTPTLASPSVAGAIAGPLNVVTRVNVPGAGRVAVTGSRGTGFRIQAFRPGTKLMPSAGIATIRSALTPATRAALRKGPVRVRITATYTASDGRTSRTTRVVTLKRLAPLPVTG